MKLLVLGASGMVGQCYLNEALARGHQVTACARNPAALAPLPPQVAAAALDVLAAPEPLAALVAAHDATLSALRPAEGSEAALVPMTRTVLQAAQAADRRAYITGGAASLLLADDSGHTVLSAPDFLPEAVRPIATACAAQDRLLDTYPQADWICLRPAALLLEAARTGRYALGRDRLVTRSDGRSAISYADFAVAMLDLVELAPRPRQKLTVGW
ncbi:MULTISPECIES: NAD(P)H-binding protein [Thioclava]|uniref:NAD(P)H-binding protein n=1 Tax=Thioclava litoralis TaxID=3076557 RepID=A0ABZ1E6K2_9RHOB|nr:NAD(P)H-binding protein [Thioclava sp. FTW29]